MKVLLVVYDNDSYIHWFPLNIAYIAAVIRKQGHQVEIYNQDVYHYSEKHLTEYLNQKKFDLIGIGVIGGYSQYRKLLKLSDAINNSRNRPFFVLGGHGPSPEPEYFLRKTHADAVVIGEGEVTIIELIKAIENRKSLSDVMGIAYRDGNNVKINEGQALVKDIDTIPFPAYELFPIEYYRLIRFPHATNKDFVMPLLSSRGCKFRCNFCYRMDKGFRPRSSEDIIEEIKLLKKNYGITYVYFDDELLMSSTERTIHLCEDFIKAELNIKWACNGRLNFAIPEVLRVMKKSGCVFINYGIEAMDNQILKNMNKKLTTEIIIKGIESTLKEGISPGYNIIFGNIGENRATLNKGVEFLLKHDDGAQLRTIRPVTPYPGCDLYYYAIEKELLKDVEDFYENRHLNSDLLAVNFTELSDEEFHAALFDANKKLLDNYFEKKKKSAIDTMKKLYFEKDITFRGFRQT